MFQRSVEDKSIYTSGFLVAAQCEPGVSVEKLENAIADALLFIEGVGKVDVDFMGIITEYPEEEDEKPI